MTVLGSAKEILGVDNALVQGRDGLQLPHGPIPPQSTQQAAYCALLLIVPAAGPCTPWSRIRPRTGLYTDLYIKGRLMPYRVYYRAEAGCSMGVRQAGTSGDRLQPMR